MRTFSRDKKWTMIVQSGTLNTTAATSNTPESIISKLKTDFSLANTELLRVSLASSSLSWVKKFIKLKGLPLFFNSFLATLKKTEYVCYTNTATCLASEFVCIHPAYQSHSYCVVVCTENRTMIWS
jgi:hypothetical protein